MGAGLRIHVLGGGPAGLFFAFLTKRSNPNCQVTVFEQNAPDVTYGFGVVLSGRALDFLSAADQTLVQRLSGRIEAWGDQHIVHKGQCVTVDGSAFSGIERIALLTELQTACRDTGVEMVFSSRVNDAARLRDCDLLVAADGASSLVRDTYGDVFGTRVLDLQNYFAWYGVESPFPAHTLTFVQTEYGVFCGHHYRYKTNMSTFVPEVDDVTWQRSGLFAMGSDERRKVIESIFVDTLRGKPLLANRSIWRRWRLVKNDRWSFENIVLIGDALRTAHPSIGSGTRLAMEDAMALWSALQQRADSVADALKLYESERRPRREKINRAAELSIDWYENVERKMNLNPYEFAYDYLMRTGIMTSERLERSSPAFMSAYRKMQAGEKAAI
jgi:2-polyprenyl-6-methoxyphenol hydroxylase-like FAD-dependent oxidoreductase